MSPASLDTVAAEIAAAEAKIVGPHPSLIRVAKPFLFQRDIEACLQTIGSSPVKEDTSRLQGVAWIENVRRALQLPVRTSNTAVIYYHKFRLVHSDTDYSYLDAAASALFTACKIEDTLKKSREILCCAHNLKLTTSTSAHHPDALSPDDQLFLGPSLTVIGLERLMLESSGFDFRNRQPQRPLIKICRLLGVPRDTVGKTAWAMCKDLYRTFAPLKQGSGTMAWACTELALRMHHGEDEGSSQIEGWLAEMKRGTEYRKWNTTRAEVMETLLDLLDLYTHSRGSTIVGGKWSLDAFIAVRIALNQEVEAEGFERYTESKDRAPATLHGSAAEDKPFDKANPDLKVPLSTLPSPVEASAPRTKPTSGERPKTGPPTGTVRFMLDPERARGEKRIVQGYWKVETEEYEEIIEREVPRDEEPRRTREAGDPRRTRERERDRERDRDRDPGRDRERDRGGRRRDRDRGEAGGRRERDRGVRRR